MMDVDEGTASKGIVSFKSFTNTRNGFRVGRSSYL